jgi:hypothetical protein
MHLRFSCLAALAWLLLRGAAPAGAAAPEASDAKRLLLIEPSFTSQLSKGTREHLRKAIAEVVARNGIAMVAASTLPDRLLRCELPGCLPQIAAASGAALVLSVEAQFAQESFKLALKLWNADEGTLLGSDRRNCPICDEQDLWGSAALLAQGLIERVRQEAPKAPPALPAVAAPLPPPVQPPSVPLAPPVPAGPSGGLAAYSGFALAVAGLATLVVGSYYVHVDGDSACSACHEVRDTAKYGWPMVIAGGAALAGGVGLLAWSFWPEHARVAVGPTGLFVAGRFR